MNLGQLLGQQMLRIMQLDDELAALKRRHHHSLDNENVKKLADFLRAAPGPQRAGAIIALLSELPESSVYTLLRELSDTGVIVRSGRHRSYCYALAPAAWIS